MPMVDPEIESAPWESQARSDAPLYLAQIEYLFERSRFYRDKLERAGFATHGAVGGLEAIEGVPLTEKDELRASRTRRRADRRASDRRARRDRAHLFDQRHDRNAELYSAHPGDLEVWVRTSARSYAASGIVRGERHRLDL